MLPDGGINGNSELNRFAPRGSGFLARSIGMAWEDFAFNIISLDKVSRHRTL